MGANSEESLVAAWVGGVGWGCKRQNSKRPMLYEWRRYKHTVYCIVYIQHTQQCYYVTTPSPTIRPRCKNAANSDTRT